MSTKGRRNKYTERDKEKAIVLMISNINPATKKPNWSRCEEVTGISRRTLERFWKAKKDDPDFARLRTQKKQEFVDEAWKDIKAAMHLGRQKIKLATAATEGFQVQIDRLIELLETSSDVDGRDIIGVIKALSSVTSIPLSHISTYFGTLYDKQALASGEATSRGELSGKDGQPFTIVIEE